MNLLVCHKIQEDFPRALTRPGHSSERDEDAMNLVYEKLQFYHHKVLYEPDFPLGTGFSYAAPVKANHSNNLQAAHHAYQFLHKLSTQNISIPFYVGGGSYSGIAVPIVTQVISGIDAGVKPWIDLKIIIPDEDDSKIPFAHEPICDPVSLRAHHSNGSRRSMASTLHGSVKCLSDWMKLSEIRAYTDKLEKLVMFERSNSSTLPRHSWAVQGRKITMSDPATPNPIGTGNVTIISKPPETSEARASIQYDEHITRLTQEVEHLWGELNRVKDLTNLSIML
ncbi:hypothetical protein BC332_08144 [Capsicum chinense]|nr:hypothetical protein BC332_08144 [Capsicum chinense]